MCGGTVYNGDRVEYDHVLGLAQGGSNDLSNGAWTHYKCHRKKTKQEIAYRE